MLHLVDEVFPGHFSEAHHIDALRRCSHRVARNRETDRGRTMVGIFELGNQPGFGVRFAAHLAGKFQLPFLGANLDIDVDLLGFVGVGVHAARVRPAQFGTPFEAALLHTQSRRVPGRGFLIHRPCCILSLVLFPVIDPQLCSIDLDNQGVGVTQVLQERAVGGILFLGINVVVVTVELEVQPVPPGNGFRNLLHTGFFPGEGSVSFAETGIVRFRHAAHRQGVRAAGKAHVIQHESTAFGTIIPVAAADAANIPVLDYDGRVKLHALFRHPVRLPLVGSGVHRDTHAVALGCSCIRIPKTFNVRGNLCRNVFVLIFQQDRCLTAFGSRYCQHHAHAPAFHGGRVPLFSAGRAGVDSTSPESNRVNSIYSGLACISQSAFNSLPYTV